MTYVHGTLYNSENMEAILVFTSRRLLQKMIVYSFNRISSTKTKK